MDISTHIRNAKLELTKVIFPTKGQVKQAYIAVVIVVVGMFSLLLYKKAFFLVMGCHIRYKKVLMSPPHLYRSRDREHDRLR